MGVPLLFCRWSLLQSIIGVSIADLVMSYYLALAFQVSHVADDAEFHQINQYAKDQKVNMEWAELQLRTSIDYGHNSKFLTFATGALNYQAAHHLFPGVMQLHYPAITPSIVKTCEKFGVEY